MSDMTITALIFDFGNVIATFSNDLFIDRVSRVCGTPPNDLYKLVYEDSGIPQDYEMGLFSSDEFYERIVTLCGVEGRMSREELQEAYTDIFTPIPTTLELIRSLKDNGYRLGLLSNTSEWDYLYGIKAVEVFPLFDHVTVSFEVGAKKPDAGIFEDMLNKLQLPPEECVYIDDIERYAKAATSLGFHGIHYTGHDALVKDLRRLGVRMY